MNYKIVVKRKFCMNKYLIYGLKDPRTDEYRYVGKTSNGLSRAKSHLNHSHNPLVNDWVNELMANDYKPDVVILENVVNQFELVDKEKYWTGKLINDGYDLCNILIRDSYNNIINAYNKQLEEQIISKELILKNKLCDLIVDKFVSPDTANLIKERRKILNITQEDLAEASGVGLRTIKSLETNNGNPTISTLNNILDCLGFELVITLKKLTDGNN